MADPVKRNKVGEADPETRRRMLREALRSGPPVKPVPKDEYRADTTPSAFDAARDLARRAKATDLAVDEPEEAKKRQRQIQAMRGSYPK